MTVGPVCVPPKTHRQFLAWQAWLDLQWNRPSRSDHYAMQIAAELVRLPFSVWGKSSHVKLNDMEISFERKEPERPPSPEEIEERKKEAARISKARWLGFMRGAVRRVKKAVKRGD